MFNKSPTTGFIHRGDLIPLFDNFCYVLSLFRKKTGDGVREGKERIERLLAFQAPDGNLPVNLHEYPHCQDPHLGLKVAPILVHILEDFSPVLDEEYKVKVRDSLEKMIQSPQSPSFEHRYQALLGKRPERPVCKTAKQWYEWIISDQLFEKGAAYPIPYNSLLNVFTGHHIAQDKNEPEFTPIESVLGRTKSGIGALYASALYPFRSSIVEDAPFSWTTDDRLLWKGLHSLVAPKAKREERGFVFDLEEDSLDEVECAVFTDVSPETSIFINGGKGTLFSLGDTITITTPAITIDLVFEADGGTFCGHLSRANRPGQIALKGDDKHSAFDWKIALRTIKRETPTRVRCSFRVV